MENVILRYPRSIIRSPLPGLVCLTKRRSGRILNRSLQLPTAWNRNSQAIRTVSLGNAAIRTARTTRRLKGPHTKLLQLRPFERGAETAPISVGAANGITADLVLLFKVRSARGTESNASEPFAFATCARLRVKEVEVI
jgi:hypothetical protein